MSVDEHQHVAFPKLFGAPAYARPPAPVTESARPVDRDDLPLAAELTPDELALVSEIESMGRSGRQNGVGADGHGSGRGGHIPSPARQHAPGDESLRPRPFLLRSLGRLRRSNG